MRWNTGNSEVCGHWRQKHLFETWSFHFWRRQWQPTPVLLPGKSHGQRNLVGCSRGVAKSRTWLSDFTFTFHFHTLEKGWQPTPVFLPGESQGQEPGGLLSVGLHRVRHDWSDLAAAAAVLVLWWSSVLESVLPPQGLRAWPLVRSGDSTSGLLWR